MSSTTNRVLTAADDDEMYSFNRPWEEARCYTDHFNRLFCKSCRRRIRGIVLARVCPGCGEREDLYNVMQIIASEWEGAVDYHVVSDDLVQILDRNNQVIGVTDSYILTKFWNWAEG